MPFASSPSAICCCLLAACEILSSLEILSTTPFCTLFPTFAFNFHSFCIEIQQRRVFSCCFCVQIRYFAINFTKFAFNFNSLHSISTVDSKSVSLAHLHATPGLQQSCTFKPAPPSKIDAPQTAPTPLRVFVCCLCSFMPRLDFSPAPCAHSLCLACSLAHHPALNHLCRCARETGLLSTIEIECKLLELNANYWN
jgi:hypothetical protein